MGRFESGYEGLAKGLQSGHQMAITSELTELARNRDTRDQEKLGMEKEMQAVNIESAKTSIETQKQQQRANEYKIQEAEREKQFGMLKSPMEFGPKEAEKIKKMVGQGGIGKEHFEVIRDPETGKETYMVSNYAQALYGKMMSSHNEMSKSILEAKLIDANNAFASAKTEYEEAKAAGKNEKELERLKGAMDSALKIKQGVDGYDQRMQEEADKKRIAAEAEAKAMGFKSPKEVEDWRNKNAERLQQLRLNAEISRQRESDAAAMERTKYMYDAKERMLRDTLDSKEYVANQKSTVGMSMFGSALDKERPAQTVNPMIRQLRKDVMSARGDDKKQAKAVMDYVKQAHMEKVYARTGDITPVRDLISQAFEIKDPIEAEVSAKNMMKVMLGTAPSGAAVGASGSWDTTPKGTKSQSPEEDLNYGF